MEQAKRKICFVITSFIHYSRSLLILEEMKNCRNVDLHIVIGGPAVVPKYFSKFADLEGSLKNAGFKNIHRIHFCLEGDEGVAKAKTAGLGTIEFSSVFSAVKPDLVVVRGDRFEVLAAAVSAAYMNIPLAHIEGGDKSGTIDESVRHAITKLANIHFATNEESRNRIIRMGEDPAYVFNFGSPDVEVVKKLSLENGRQFDINSTGSGYLIDLERDFIMVIFHPVTSQAVEMIRQTKILLEAVNESGIQAVWFWPNFDSGSEEISHQLRSFNDLVANHRIRFMKYLPPHYFFSLLRKSCCLLGNSSAGIKECSYLGIPVVNLGSRQKMRLRAGNVIDADFDKEKIKEALSSQIKAGVYPVSDLYSGSGAGRNIAQVLATAELYTQKSFAD